MAMNDQQGVPDGWEVIQGNAPAQPAAGHWEDRGIAGQVWHPATPAGSERTRQDTGTLGFDHEDMQHRIADWASKLPAAWQKPAAMLVGAPADILASLVEAVSSPEAVATVGAKPALSAMDTAAAKVSATRQALTKPADVLLDAAVKKLGVDPDALELQAARMRLQAARSRTRQATMRANLANQATPPAETPLIAAQAPVQTPPSVPASPPPAPVAAPVTPPSTPIPAGVAMKQVADTVIAKQVKLAPYEVSNAAKMVQRGLTPEDAIARVVANRPPMSPAEAMAQRYGTPSDEAVAADVAAKNARTTRAKGGTKD